MTLEPGVRLGVYETLASIGVGGMGEVYRARDTKLGREVAIKVLPDEFAKDPARLARFEREARLLATLNHTNIATLFGLEESDGVTFLVLELVPGETLQERIARGPIPLDEIRSLFVQLTDGLDAAHETGVLHRDLKPANMKITPDGDLKILDFGLAKPLDDPTGEQEEGEGLALSQSPTLTRDQTRAGVILGTAPYMSPEQARGKPVDKRTDVWAFGCVLYEALTGKRAFDGDTVTDIIAAIVRAEPDWGALPEDVPPRMRRLLEWCLEKDRRQRLRDIGDARRDFAEAGDIEPAAPRARTAIITAAIASLLAGVVGGALLMRAPTAPVPDSTRFTISLPNGGLYPSPSLSVDGRHLVYRADNQLYLRHMDEFETKPIPGTVGARQPFFSPDGQWIGFLRGGELEKILMAGGAPVSIAALGSLAAGGSDPSWSADGVIIFGAYFSPLMHLSADGGPLSRLTSVDRDAGELSHHVPQILPDGEHVLFTVARIDVPRIAVASLRTGEHRALFEGAGARYLPSGHVVFERSGNLLAVAFDLSAMAPRGTAVPVVEGVHTPTNASVRFPHYSISSTGTLVYNPGDETFPHSIVVSVNRDGVSNLLMEDAIGGLSTAYPRLSPDGRQLVVSAETDVGRNLWLYDLERGGRSRVTFDGSQFVSSWSRDGTKVAFNSDHAGQGIYWKAVDAGGPGDALSVRENFHWPGSWSPDDRLLAFMEIDTVTKGDIWILPLEENGEAFPFAATAFDERAPVFSPDGRHLAFVSDESGQNEVYVQPFPGPGGKQIVSIDGGSEPVWSADGTELFYRRDDALLVVEVALEPELRPGQPKTLFEDRYARSPMGPPAYDVSPNGQRFVMFAPSEDARTTEFHVVLNWFDELERLVPSLE